MILDLLSLLMNLVIQLWQDSHVEFFIICAAGLLLGGLAWWLTSLVALNFNRQFSFHLKHHFYCGVAAFLTLMFTLFFVAFRHTGRVAEDTVEKWKDAILADKEWSYQTFCQAYDAVYALRDASGRQLEDFAAHPRPDTGRNTSIPTNHEASKQAAAQTYAKGAVNHFRSHHPFLSVILWANPESAQQVITKDMERFFSSNPGSTYQARDAIQLAGEMIRHGLREQVPRVVVISRTILLTGFLLLQGITLALLIRTALADINEKRSLPRFTGG